MAKGGKKNSFVYPHSGKTDTLLTKDVITFLG